MREKKRTISSLMKSGRHKRFKNLEYDFLEDGDRLSRRDDEEEDDEEIDQSKRVSDPVDPSTRASKPSGRSKIAGTKTVARSTSVPGTQTVPSSASVIGADTVPGGKRFSIEQPPKRAGAEAQPPRQRGTGTDSVTGTKSVLSRKSTSVPSPDRVPTRGKAESKEDSGLVPSTKSMPTSHLSATELGTELVAGTDLVVGRGLASQPQDDQAEESLAHTRAKADLESGVGSFRDRTKSKTSTSAEFDELDTESVLDTNSVSINLMTELSGSSEASASAAPKPASETIAAALLDEPSTETVPSTESVPELIGGGVELGIEKVPRADSVPNRKPMEAPVDTESVSNTGPVTTGTEAGFQLATDMVPSTTSVTTKAPADTMLGTEMVPRADLAPRTKSVLQPGPSHEEFPAAFADAGKTERLMDPDSVPSTESVPIEVDRINGDVHSSKSVPSTNSVPRSDMPLASKTMVKGAQPESLELLSIPRCLLVRLAREDISLREMKIFLAIAAACFASADGGAEISGNDLEARAGVFRSHVFTALKTLVERGLIRKEKQDSAAKNLYRINLGYFQEASPIPE